MSRFLSLTLRPEVARHECPTSCQALAQGGLQPGQFSAPFLGSPLVITVVCFSSSWSFLRQVLAPCSSVALPLLSLLLLVLSGKASLTLVSRLPIDFCDFSRPIFSPGALLACRLLFHSTLFLLYGPLCPREDTS